MERKGDEYSSDLEADMASAAELSDNCGVWLHRSISECMHAFVRAPCLFTTPCLCTLDVCF